MHRHTLHKLRNILHSAILVAGMCLIAASCAWILWGVEGMLWALAGFALAAALSPTVPASFVLSLYRARPLARSDFPPGYTVLGELSRRARLPATPRLYYLPSSLLNAFAVGNRRSAAIAVTAGMLRHMNLRELSGVLAHEVSHIANQDLWIMNLADAMSRATTLLSYIGMFLLFINLPLIATGAVTVPWALVLLLLFAPTRRRKSESDGWWIWGKLNPRRQHFRVTRSSAWRRPEASDTSTAARAGTGLAFGIERRCGRK